jgi:hypothetical protein
MGLVKDNTRPRTLIYESWTSNGPLIIDHIQMLGTRVKVLGKFPLFLA